MYKIELLCDHNHKWERSWSFGGEYTLVEAQALIAKPGFEQWTFRIVPVRVQYRRHAAVSQLELRGAIALLDSARQRINGAMALAVPSLNNDAYDAWAIIVTALSSVTRQLEAL